MLALSPPLFSSNGWLVDDSMSHQQQQQQPPQQPPADYYQQHFSGIPKELLSPPQQSLLHFYFSQPSDDHPQQLDCFDPVTPSPKAASGDPSMVKKLNHNASERDRRRKINGLYSSLRSLLPASDQTKKLSIPSTVSRVLKYIPELQQQVQKLAKEKEDLLMRIPSKNEAEEDSPSAYYRGGLGIRQRTNSSASPEVVADERRSVSANRLSEREVAVQISTKKETESPLPEILLNLERDGFSLVNASTFESFGDNRVFYNLHVQDERINASDCDKVREKILSLCRKSDRVLPKRPGIH
ncbi:transcription factor ORG2-like isoform X2 [Punica granatum]|uniref:Transcription factor ORG2-like isoform X2 n=1 Tax=Punica granatum TaxID=22663 RepID=A0A218XMF2_PUNGR|nr:transcription factor ORG2-like isoform X2 [Punica granatum]OWM85472.1 hypothetical protein CDL15_Pgr019096 [Punica granatum]